MENDLCLDDMDVRIIEELRHDGRQANTEIARKLGVSETMIRHRIKKLVGRGVVQVAARVNLARLGHDICVQIGVICAGGENVDMSQVVQRLAAIPAVRRIAYVTGRYDLLLSATFRCREDLFAFLVEELRRIPGVFQTETIHQLRIAKRDFNFWDVG